MAEEMSHLRCPFPSAGPLIKPNDGPWLKRFPAGTAARWRRSRTRNRARVRIGRVTPQKVKITFLAAIQGRGATESMPQRDETPPMEGLECRGTAGIRGHTIGGGTLEESYRRRAAGIRNGDEINVLGD